MAVSSSGAPFSQLCSPFTFITVADSVMRLEIAPIPSSLCRWKSRSLWEMMNGKTLQMTVTGAFHVLSHSCSISVSSFKWEIISGDHAHRKLYNSVLRAQKSWAVSDSGIIKAG